jgi:hypothetical protein
MNEPEEIILFNPDSGTDEYGDPIDGDFTNEGTFHGFFSPKQSEEPSVIGAQPVIVPATVYVREQPLPAVTERSRVEIRGELFTVEGEPSIFKRDFESFMSFSVERVKDRVNQV